METYYLITIFILGLLFGSFFNVVGYRLPNDLSIVKPRSFCPTCNKQLKWYENIPLFSFIIQGAKCRSCKTKISLFYPFIELTTGVLFALSYYLFGFSETFYLAIIMSSYLVIVIVSDCKYMIISDEVTAISVILLIIVRFIHNPLLDSLYYILSGLALFMVMYLLMLMGNKIFKKESLGGGDIKLMLAVGIACGFLEGLFSIFLASFIALPISLVFYFKSKDNVVPFGPFLLIGALMMIIFKIDLSMFFII